MTTKLSDAQLVVLSAACQRPDRNVLPLPERMTGGAAQKIITSLLAKELIEELAAGSSGSIPSAWNAAAVIRSVVRPPWSLSRHTGSPRMLTRARRTMATPR